MDKVKKIITLRSTTGHYPPLRQRQAKSLPYPQRQLFSAGLLYRHANPDLRTVRPPQEERQPIDLEALVNQLRGSPELARTLAMLIHG